jgi:hypothetical protein
MMISQLNDVWRSGSEMKMPRMGQASDKKDKPDEIMASLLLNTEGRRLSRRPEQYTNTGA